MPTTPAPLQREIRILVRALLAFLSVLIVALFSLVVSIIGIDRAAATADDARNAISAMAERASRADLEARLELLRGANGIGRIEVYRNDRLFAATGPPLLSAEVVTLPLQGGRMLIYFDVSGWTGGRRTSLVVGALATFATIAGLLILILYLPKFMQPLAEMLDQAQQLREPHRGDDDARYLVQTFREAVERIQQQSRELDGFRDAAASRTPDVRELAGAIHRSFSSGFIALDESGEVVALNDAGRTMLGSERETPALDELPPAFADAIRGSLASRAALTRQEVMIGANDALIGLTTVPLFEGESFLGLFGLFTDLTTLRAMEGRIRDLENLVGLGQVSAGIAHEFRNSLFTMLGYLRLARRTASDEVAARISRAEAEAQRLAGAVDTLLNFARPLEVGSQRLRFDAVVEDVVDRIRAEAPDVQFDCRVVPFEVSGDRELLVRAVDNLVRNAVDAVRERHGNAGGRVQLDLTTQPHPRLTIRDNGVGVDPETAPRLLLPFQSAKPHGFGLGLPLARKIAVHHGATLSLTGVPGEGATAVLDFLPN